MLQPFEVVTAKLLPTIRARLAQVLLEDFGMKQIEVARHLGITQAAVSHYKTASRGVDPDLLRLFPEINAYVHTLADQIAEGMTQPEQVASISGFIDKLMSTQRFCDFHKKVAAIDPACAACFPKPPRP